MENVLQGIIRNVIKSTESKKSVITEAEIQRLCETARSPFSFANHFNNSSINIISEVKFASPSEGQISVKTDPVETAKSYLQNGARALSILTEEDSFGGHISFLHQIRRNFPQSLILRKDFIVDPYQIYESRVFGADAILLIVAALGKEKLKNFLEISQKLQLTPLVEVHDEEEFAIASELGAKLIGVNNRNLKTMEIDINTSMKIARLANRSQTLISESGISDSSQINLLQNSGYKGFLIGTALMKTKNPGDSLARLIESASVRRAV